MNTELPTPRPTCRRFLVSGRVQGVFYRASTQAEAERLGLTGWARNLNDGCVEVLACGDADALNELARWLQDGPPRARVEAVKELAVECEPPSGFATR